MSLETFLRGRLDLSVLTAKAKRQWPLLIVLMVLFVVAATVAMALGQPIYLATAQIGPPGQRLDATELGGASGAAASLASRLGLKRSLGGTDTNYDKYISVLTSNRLAAGLTRDTDVLQKVFYKQWDADARQWRTGGGGTLASTKNAVKQLLHRPVKSQPDADDLNKYLAAKFSLDAPLSSQFATVSITARSPEEAEVLLGAILKEADNLIREERRRDVAARIAYLEKVLPTVDAADQRTSLAAVLSAQQQSMMEIEADQLYAYSMVDPPHAQRIPIAPNPKTNYVLALLLALICWAGLVAFGPEGALRLRSGHMKG
jgi:capsular polysaccharide biosynthesis protein